MTETVSIPDNGHEIKLPLSEEQWKDLSQIAGRTVKELCDLDESGISLLVFPDSLDIYGDKIGDNTIIEIKDNTISSGNLMGFIGWRNTRLRIHSRFDFNENDYFMHYLLEKVFSINMFDLKFSMNAESVFDFILFLFPSFLKRALSQGIYKEYVTHHCNDDNIKGALDISRHIRLNTPFTGNVAYRMREFTSDNLLMELVRHTIEYIRTKEFGTNILSHDEETKTAVSLVINATPLYSKHERERIISRNLRSKIHPYYSEYEPLRRLCIQILRQEEIKYGNDDDTVYGVLFDGAWLWEEYLYTILHNFSFIHPKNKIGDKAIYLFKYNIGPRYPDYYNSQVVLDAKYKRYDKKGVRGVSRDDLAQVISYMYVLAHKVGGFIVPGGDTATIDNEYLNGEYGGEIVLLNLPIATWAVSYQRFCQAMYLNECGLAKSIQQILLDR